MCPATAHALKQVLGQQAGSLSRPVFWLTARLANLFRGSMRVVCYGSGVMRLLSAQAQDVAFGGPGMEPGRGGCVRRLQVAAHSGLCYM